MGNFNLIAIIVFVMLLGSQVQGWVALGNYHNAANPGKCTINNELIIKPGDSVKSPTDCAQITCDSDDGMATITGCGSIAPPENCRWGDYVDMHAPYSQCCLRHAICTDYNDETSAYIDNIKNMLRASIVSNNFK